MARIALSNNSGSSLIEVLISLLILAIVAVALMQSSLLVLQSSMRNDMRDEAVRILEQRMNELRTNKGGFDNANPDGNHIDLQVEDFTFPPLTRIIRSAAVQFTINKLVETKGADTKQVTLKVTWQYRGQEYSHSVMSLIRRY